jgi:hypothetical protein
MLTLTGFSFIIVFVICENHNDPDLVQAFLKKWWALIEEYSSIDTGEVKNNTAA